MFHPVVEAWFRGRFGEPTPAQAAAWPVIASGRDALVAAPTGSGKTLAAFLFCVDRLVRQALAGELVDETQVVYVSPLKALSNDVRKNLDEPLAELILAAAAQGQLLLPIRTAVRTGDTSASERRALSRKPPHILVTTPESLYILLTSISGRAQLSTVHTVIVDEIHAVAPDKRGAHLALSLERLDALVQGEGGAPARPQRIGLSATVRPLEVAAQLLVGAGRPSPELIDVGMRRALDLAVEVPHSGDELGAVCTHEQWAELYERIASLCREHRSTLVFVNTRRLVERVAHALGERLGEEAVAAHHGSLSRARRFDAEQKLKSGSVKLVVATASLELGIDVGSVDLVCLIGSPRSIATGLQRIGRSGHAVGALPKGRLFPLTRDQLVECAALVSAGRRGELDRIALRRAPLDVLAQQIVASCAAEDWQEDALFELCRRAAPYAALRRDDFDDMVEILSEGVSSRRGRRGALLHRDAVGQRLRGRRGARLAAMTSGGAIPDNANYDVVLDPEGTLIGNIDEDFAIESMAGDIMLLGNASWRIRRVEAGRVRVEAAPGMPPTIPFWLGEGPARTRELSTEVAALRQAVATRLTEAARVDGDVVDWLMAECALERAGAELLRDYLAAGIGQLGAVPTQTRVVAERFFDESGGMQLVIHAPFGGRINRAWGLALRKRFCKTFDFELQAAATDDGVLLSLGPQHSFPLPAIFELLEPTGLIETLRQAAIQAPMFTSRWRWNAGRALILLRHQGGRRVPPPIQRMRAEDLLAAVFPEQLGCQDNHGTGPLEIPDHPLVAETLRDCLSEAMDAEGLLAVLEALKRGDIETVTCETPEPSVFSHEILNANPYAFLDDAPLEERRARAVSVRRGLPADVAERIGGLDPAAIAAVIAEARPVARDADELHDVLLELCALPADEGHAAGWSGYFDELCAARRAARLHGGGIKGGFWVAAERRGLALAVWPDGHFEPPISEPARRARVVASAAVAVGPAVDAGDAALAELLRGRLGISGPCTAARLGATLERPPADVELALYRVEMEGSVLRGRFSPGLAADVVEWCDRRLLARINRRTLDVLRREIEPVSQADFMRYLLAWQHVGPHHVLHGKPGLLQILRQLQGVELAAAAWERFVLPARLSGYEPSWLDALCLSGEVAWGRLSPREGATAPARPSRAAPIAIFSRRDLGWLLTPPTPPADDARAETNAALSPPARAVLAHLETAGASFLDELTHAAGLRQTHSTLAALGELVSAGLVTGDGFGALRGLIGGPGRRTQALGIRSARWQRAAGPSVGSGRWCLLRPRGLATGDDSSALEALARQYLARYGVVFRELLGREPRLPSWRDLLGIYRRMEMRGELRGGRFVAGYVGEQFALPEALESLRAVRKQPKSGARVRLSACDPLNLVGVLGPGARMPATTSNFVVYEDGAPQTGAGLFSPTAQAPAAL